MSASRSRRCRALDSDKAECAELARVSGRLSQIGAQEAVIRAAEIARLDIARLVSVFE